MSIRNLHVYSLETSTAANTSSKGPEITGRKFCCSWGRQGREAALSPGKGSASASLKAHQALWEYCLKCKPQPLLQEMGVSTEEKWVLICCVLGALVLFWLHSWIHYHQIRMSVPKPFSKILAAENTTTVWSPHMISKLRQILDCILQTEFTAPPQHATSWFTGTSISSFSIPHNLTLIVFTPLLLG